MNRDEVYEQLKHIDHSKQKRLRMAHLVLDNPSVVLALLDIAVEVKDPTSSRACWVLEFAAREDHRYLDAHLDRFIIILPNIHLESSIRPMAKICEILILEHYANSPSYSSKLKGHHLEQIATVCFDWLIGPHKVAPKAFAMICLYHLGKSFPWIHPELRLVLEQNYPKGSPAYKARARRVLASLDKKSL